MVSKVWSCAVVGLKGEMVEVEVDVSPGFPSFNIVGLPDTAVREARERVQSAIKCIGFSFPRKRVVVNLAPANLRKEGASYDLPIAVGILAASGNLSLPPEKNLFTGELGLKGTLRSVKGLLPIVISAREQNFHGVFLPKVNEDEASLINNIAIFGASNLSEVVLHLKREEKIKPIVPRKLEDFLSSSRKNLSDFSLIKGQKHAKRALEIAAAGHHNILMSGPPGTGKTLLAHSLPSIMPRISFREALEVTKIYSVAGRLKDQSLIVQRPFRSPHHTISEVAMVGGGKWPSPGEISLAHRGVLFLDEFPEFSARTLESLRQPLEDGVVTISRAKGSLTFPARFALVAAMNPCPCGFSHDPEKECTCSAREISRYRRKISGPLLDRIDMQIEVPRVKYEKLFSNYESESSKEIKKRVEKACSFQKERFTDSFPLSNSEMNLKQIKQKALLSSAAKKMLSLATREMLLSARAYYRTIKLARTIADLALSKEIEEGHVAEALQYRLHK